MRRREARRREERRGEERREERRRSKEQRRYGSDAHISTGAVRQCIHPGARVDTVIQLEAVIAGEVVRMRRGEKKRGQDRRKRW